MSNKISTNILTGANEQAQLIFCNYAEGVASLVASGDAGLMRVVAGILDDECDFPCAFVAFSPSPECPTIQTHIWQAQQRFKTQRRL